MKNIYKLLVLLVFVSLFAACGGDVDKPTPPVVKEEHAPKEISAFIWEGLDYWYLWENEVDALALNKGTEEWKKYLNGYGTEYKKLFESLLHRVPNAEGTATVDRWSWIVDDYEKQENAFAGISESFGYEYRLSRYKRNGKEDGVFGYVTYIVPNSPASATELKRGDLFTSVDGQDMTISNYRNLLFTKKSYELGFSDLKDKVLIPNQKKVSMTAVNLTENPVHMAKVIPNTKVGYLVYNSFTGTNEFNVALNDSVGKLKDAGITDLVLDLRYNGGGSVYSAILLCSMIDGTRNGQVLAVKKYNDAVRKDNSKHDFNDYFVDKIKTNYGRGTLLATIKSLNLSRLFVLTSKGTASASEMVINGLKPYIDVILIGTRTHGKYVGSMTLYDYIDNKRTKNPNHKWAMQPIIFKVANSKGESDYGDGFAPDYKRNEWSYLGDIKPLGNPDEPYLKAALGVIAGESVPVEDVVTTRAGNEGRTIFDSKDLKPFSKEMYDERMQFNLRDFTK